MHQNRILLIFLLFIAKGICNEYCDLYEKHVLCVNPPAGESCPQFFKAAIPDEKQQKAIVDWHNKMRQKVALGKESRGSDGPQPSASNMMKMKWDPELAKIAQSTANQCIDDHDCDPCRKVLGGRFSVGQNLATFPLQNQTTLDFVKAIEQWYEEEVKDMNPNWVDSYVFGDWGHYSQVVWWNTRSVGCGGVSYQSYQDPDWFDFLVFCNYGAGANLPETKVYEKGKSCSKCPEETKCDSEYDGLCSITRENFKYNDKFPTDQVYLGLPEGSSVVI